MHVSTFISLASLLLCTWLGVAFFREVPTRSYPATEAAIANKPAEKTTPILAMKDTMPPGER